MNTRGARIHFEKDKTMNKKKNSLRKLQSHCHTCICVYHTYGSMTCIQSLINKKNKK